MNEIMVPLMVVAIVVWVLEARYRERVAKERADELHDLDNQFKRAMWGREQQTEPTGASGPPLRAYSPDCVCGHRINLHNPVGHCLLCECKNCQFPVYSTGYGYASTGAALAPDKREQWGPLGYPGWRG